MISDHPTPILSEKPVVTGEQIDTKELIAAVKEAQEAVKCGEFVTFEEIKKEFSSWITE